MDQNNFSDYDDSSEEETITNGITYVATYCVEMYFEKYMHREPYMTSQYNGQKWGAEVLDGHN